MNHKFTINNLPEMSESGLVVFQSLVDMKCLELNVVPD